MALFVATYDLQKTTPDPYSAFIASAEGFGWNTTIPLDGQPVRLPNTTLVGNFQSIDAAAAAFERARVKAATVLGGAVTVQGSYLSEVTGTALVVPKSNTLGDILGAALLGR